MLKRPKSVQIRLSLGFVNVAGTWEPNEAERRAAWDLYVELVTRVSVVPLPTGHGVLREALASLYSLFGSTRQVLRTHGPDVAQLRADGQYNFAYLAVAVLNLVVRPLLAEWHPLLLEWESHRPADRSAVEHEDSWTHAAQLRAVLESTRQVLSVWAAILAEANGIPDLSAAISTRRGG